MLFFYPRACSSAHRQACDAFAVAYLLLSELRGPSQEIHQ